MGEAELIPLLCAFLLGAEPEVRKDFENVGRTRAVRVDCETDTHVIEVGLDGKASSRDSVHQAVFAAFLTRKQPAVVLIDRDNQEDRYEQELRVVTSMLDIPFAVCKEAFLVRWASTSPFRDVGVDKTLGDLPAKEVSALNCDLSALGGPEGE